MRWARISIRSGKDPVTGECHWNAANVAATYPATTAR